MLPLRDDVPTRIAPTVTIALVALNVAVFLYELSLEGPRSHGGAEKFIEGFAVIPRALLAPRPQLRTWLTPLTSMFLHGGFLHIAGNMLYLWIFGNNIEDLLGHGRYLVFYLFCGLVAVATQVATAPDSSVPVIGASGAIAGVLGAYAVSYPTARIRTLIFLGFIWTVYLPAVVLLVLWFVMQILSGTQQGGGAGGVAWWAHVGGFLAGALLVKPFQVRPPVRARIPI